MSDLINRQDAIYALTEANLKSHMDSVEGGQENRSAIRIIMELPSAERKHGEWLQISPAKIYECSACGQNVMTTDIDCYSFCHGCGADMRGK